MESYYKSGIITFMQIFLTLIWVGFIGVRFEVGGEVKFCKKTTFSRKNSTFTQSNSVRAVLEIF